VVTSSYHAVTMEVGIRELKAHLSEYIEKACNGEPVVITDRGRPRVRLVAISDDWEQLPARYRELVLAGKVKDPGPPRYIPKPLHIKLPPGETTTDWIKWARGCDHE